MPFADEPDGTALAVDRVRTMTIPASAPQKDLSGGSVAGAVMA